MERKKVYLVMKEGTMEGAFIEKDDAEDCKKRIDEEDFEEARESLDYDADDMDEDKVDDVLFQQGFDSGCAEVVPVDISNYESGDDVPVDDCDDTVRYDEIIKVLYANDDMLDDDGEADYE